MELLLDVLHSFCIIFRVKIAQSTLCSLPRIHAISMGKNQERENQKEHCSHFGVVFYFSYFYRTNFEMTLLPATLIKINFFKMSELYQPETDWNMFCYVILISTLLKICVKMADAKSTPSYFLGPIYLGIRMSLSDLRWHYRSESRIPR